jgi:hypothetical protein
MAYKRDLANPLAPTFGSNERKKPKKKKKKTKTINLKEVKVPAVGRYTDRKQKISKAKKQAKNFSKNESTGYAASIKPKKVTTTRYQDGKKVKTTVVKVGKPVKERGSEVRDEKKLTRQMKRDEKKLTRQQKRNAKKKN